VVVAASAADGKSQERLADVLGHVLRVPDGVRRSSWRRYRDWSLWR
jgi:hypothetical protein